MASFELYLQEINDKSCECSICLEHLQEPKRLPCRHHFCRDCLETLFETQRDLERKICPLCRGDFLLPKEGVDGFKTDFFMRNIVRYVQSEKSLEEQQLRECCNCLQNAEVTAYCCRSECNGFLCKECHNAHLTETDLEEHKQHSYPVRDFISKQLIRKVSGLKEAPKCQNHDANSAQLCCASCRNLPICLTCAQENHHNHHMKGVSTLAVVEMLKLNNELETMIKCEDRIPKLTEEVEIVEKELTTKLMDWKTNFQITYEKDVQIVKAEMDDTEETYETDKTEIEKKEKRDLLMARKQMEDEISEAKKRYDTICNEIVRVAEETLETLKKTKQEELCRTEIEKNEKRVLLKARKQMETEISEVKKEYDSLCNGIVKVAEEELETLKKTKWENLEKCNKKLKMLEDDEKLSSNMVTQRQEPVVTKLQEISRQVEDTRKRFNDLTFEANKVFELNVHWRTVECAPKISSAIQHLNADMKNDYPELRKLASMRFEDGIIDKKTFPVDLEKMKSNDFTFLDIKDSNEAFIVYFERTSSDEESRITVMNMVEEILRKDNIKNPSKSPCRFCVSLSHFKVVTVRWSNEIGIYDVRDGSYITKTLRELTAGEWSQGQDVSCVTTNPANSLILVVAFNSRELFVFDDRLNFHHKLTLPDMIKNPRAMSVVESGYLVVCDNLSKKAYLVTTDGFEGELLRTRELRTLTETDPDGEEMSPVSVCTDKNGFVYMLWAVDENVTERRILKMYRPNCLGQLASQPLDERAISIATVVVEGTEKLVVTTGWQSHMLYIYNIIAHGVGYH